MPWAQGVAGSNPVAPTISIIVSRLEGDFAIRGCQH